MTANVMSTVRPAAQPDTPQHGFGGQCGRSPYVVWVFSYLACVLLDKKNMPDPASIEPHSTDDLLNELPSRVFVRCSTAYLADSHFSGFHKWLILNDQERDLTLYHCGATT